MQIQLEKLTASFQSVTEDVRRRFVVDGEPLLEEGLEGRSPILGASFSRTTGFSIPSRPTLASSGKSLPICPVSMAAAIASFNTQPCPSFPWVTRACGLHSAPTHPASCVCVLSRQLA